MEQLIEAIHADDAVRVQELLHSGFDPNGCEDSVGVTPLHFVAQSTQYNALEIAHLLIRAGADPTSETDEGQTPAEIAFLHFNKEMIELLEKRDDGSAYRRTVFLC